MATPILKWVGGKGRLLPQLTPLLPPTEEIHHYAEPFVGGGAMLFHVASHWPESRQKLFRWEINDKNAALMHFYRAVADRPYDVADLACRLASGHNASAFRAARKAYNALQPLLKEQPLATSHSLRTLHAALFLYLNKCGFNGLYRVNRAGELNVAPNPNATWRPKTSELGAELLRAKDVLLPCGLHSMPFDAFIDQEISQSIMTIDPEHVFFFCDPPYLNEMQNSFTGYDSDEWNEFRLMELGMCMQQVHEAGCRFMVTHADTQLARNIFSHPAYNLTPVAATQTISTTASGRVPRQELVIRNYR